MCDISSVLIKALEERKLTDVKFVCPSDDSSGNVVIEAHKPILMLSSPVFEAMFIADNEDFMENKYIIKINDIHAGAFEALIRIIYGQDVDNVSILMAVELYYASEKYDIPEAKQTAKSFIIQLLGKANRVLPIYELCSVYGNYPTQELCIKYIMQNTEKILHTATFLTCQPSTLVKIFSLDTLNIESEYTLVQAYVRYLVKHKDAEESIFEALKYIRFLTIDPDNLLRIKFFKAEDLLTIIRIAKYQETEDNMPLNLSKNRTGRGTYVSPDLKNFKEM